MPEPDPIRLGEKASWFELAALGSGAWNIWADLEKHKPDADKTPIKLDDTCQKIRNWDGFIFPTKVDLAGLNVSKDLKFLNCHFLGGLDLSNATIGGSFDLEHCNFSGIFSLNHARVRGTLSVHCSKFCGPADFDYVRLDSEARIRQTDFCGETRFVGATFHKFTSFQKLNFFANAYFNEAEFRSSVDFTIVNFKSDTIFVRTEFHRRFLLRRTIFARVPDLRDADFKGLAPNFRYVEVQFSDKLLGGFRRHKDGDAHDKYRHIKKLAADSHDHEVELDMAAHETMAKRFWLHRPIGKGMAAFWLGYVYQLTSNFGRSIFLPGFWLVAVAFVFFFLFSSVAVGHGFFAFQWPPIVNWPTGLVAAVVSLVPFAGQAVVGRQIMVGGTCGQLSSPPKEIELDCLATLYVLSAVEGLLGVVFLFLLALGLRNRFRIK